MELETKLKEEKDKNERLTFENGNLVKGIQGANPQARRDDYDTDLMNPSAVAEELRQIKRKNDSLKRENEIIRRELASLKDRDLNSKPQNYPQKELNLNSQRLKSAQFLLNFASVRMK